VNVRFTDVNAFEFTGETAIFDLLRLPLVHGWLVDPSDAATAAAVGAMSYNALVERLVSGEAPPEQALALQSFLERSASQLTPYGLQALHERVPDGTLAVFFRNNHFCTAYKHRGGFYLLVTDEGYRDQAGLVWESLSNVDGDTPYMTGAFEPFVPPAPAAAGGGLDALTDAAAVAAAGGAPPVSDAEAATLRMLQEEEDMRTAQMLSAQLSGHAQGSGAGAGAAAAAAAAGDGFEVVSGHRGGGGGGGGGGSDDVIARELFAAVEAGDVERAMIALAAGQDIDARDVLVRGGAMRARTQVAVCVPPLTGCVLCAHAGAHAAALGGERGAGGDCAAAGGQRRAHGAAPGPRVRSCAPRADSAPTRTQGNTDDNGHTPLHLAALAGSRALVQTLLDAGANPAARDQARDQAAHVSPPCAAAARARLTRILHRRCVLRCWRRRRARRPCSWPPRPTFCHCCSRTPPQSPPRSAARRRRPPGRLPPRRRPRNHAPAAAMSSAPPAAAASAAETTTWTAMALLRRRRGKPSRAGLSERCAPGRARAPPAAAQTPAVLFRVRFDGQRTCCKQCVWRERCVQTSAACCAAACRAHARYQQHRARARAHEKAALSVRSFWRLRQRRTRTRARRVSTQRARPRRCNALRKQPRSWPAPPAAGLHPPPRAHAPAAAPAHVTPGRASASAPP
jgi:hypothetical protein